ncbi:MAG: HD domain-containing protein [bacterium]|nr:HD domain-containing protein [bacterium]
METRIKVDLEYLNSNKTLVYPLYTEEGVKIVEGRVLLTPEKIEEIKKIHGTIVYYDKADMKAYISPERVEKAINVSKNIMDEISHTQKLSRESFHSAETIIEDMVMDLNRSEVKIIDFLEKLRSYEEYLYQHSVNVGILAAIFAKKLGKYDQEDIKNIALGAYLIDIGEMKIDKQLLNKRGKYDISEMQIIKRHPQLGYEILSKLTNLSPVVLQTVLFHHEKFNDQGYYSLPYQNLPSAPKLVAACDIYDAFTTKRPYREAVSPANSLKMLVNLIDNQFDYKMVSNFINILGPMLNNTQAFYARSDFCKLNSEEIALVKDYGGNDFLKPQVMVFCKLRKVNNRMEVVFYKSAAEVDLQRDPNRHIIKIINNVHLITTLKSKLRQRDMLLEYIH